MASGRKQLTLIADIPRILRSGGPEVRGYEVRCVEVSDKAALAELYHASFSRELVPDMDDANKEMEEAFRGDYGPLDEDASLVAVDGEMLAAAILTVKQAPWPDTPPGPFIIDLFIHPDARRQGLARHLIVAAARELGRSGKATVALRVMSDNAGALQLYKSLGFGSPEL